jgi:hypothetical protein
MHKNARENIGLIMCVTKLSLRTLSYDSVRAVLWFESNSADRRTVAERVNAVMRLDTLEFVVMSDTENREHCFRELARENRLDLTDMTRVQVEELLSRLAFSDVVFAFDPNGKAQLVKGALHLQELSATDSGLGAKSVFGVLVAHSAHFDVMSLAADKIAKGGMTPTVCRNFLELLALVPAHPGAFDFGSYSLDKVLTTEFMASIKILGFPRK